MNVPDFTSELHVRMFVLDILKDRLHEEGFEGLANKALDFLMRGIKLRPVPDSPTDIAEALAKVMVPSMFPLRTPLIDMEGLESIYHRYRYRDVVDPMDSGRHGVIAGFSKEFDSLVVVCDEDGDKGVDSGDTDFVDLPGSFAKNGFFFFFLDDVIKQLGE